MCVLSRISLAGLVFSSVRSAAVRRHSAVSCVARTVRSRVIVQARVPRHGNHIGELHHE